MTEDNNTLSPADHMGSQLWRYRSDDKAMWQYGEGGKPVLDGWIVEALHDNASFSEAVAVVREMVRLADMGLEESLKEPEENGNYSAYLRAKRFLAGRSPAPAPNVIGSSSPKPSL